MKYPYFSFLVQTRCVPTNVVRALVDVVATKLGILFFLFSLSSFHLLFFLLCGYGVHALWVSANPPRRTHIPLYFSEFPLFICKVAATAENGL